MKTTKNNFSKPVQYNGIVFESILECKYALQIEDEYDYYYHPPLGIYYDKNDKSKFGKQTCGDLYKPDFLIRNIQDGTSYLVEVKSSIDRYHPDTLNKEYHAKEFIKRNNKDWKYIILTENEIQVPNSKYTLLNQARITRVSVANKKRAIKKHNRYSNQKNYYRATKIPIIRHHKNLDESDYFHYIRTGVIKGLE